MDRNKVKTSLLLKLLLTIVITLLIILSTGIKVLAWNGNLPTEAWLSDLDSMALDVFCIEHGTELNSYHDRKHFSDWFIGSTWKDEKEPGDKTAYDYKPIGHVYDTGKRAYILSKAIPGGVGNHNASSVQHAIWNYGGTGVWKAPGLSLSKFEMSDLTKGFSTYSGYGMGKITELKQYPLELKKNAEGEVIVDEETGMPSLAEDFTDEAIEARLSDFYGDWIDKFKKDTEIPNEIKDLIRTEFENLSLQDKTDVIEYSLKIIQDKNITNNNVLYNLVYDLVLLCSTDIESVDSLVEPNQDSKYYTDLLKDFSNNIKVAKESAKNSKEHDAIINNTDFFETTTQETEGTYTIEKKDKDGNIISTEEEIKKVVVETRKLKDGALKIELVKEDGYNPVCYNQEKQLYIVGPFVATYPGALVEDGKVKSGLTEFNILPSLTTDKEPRTFVKNADLNPEDPNDGLKENEFTFARLDKDDNDKLVTTFDVKKNTNGMPDNGDEFYVVMKWDGSQEIRKLEMNYHYEVYWADYTVYGGEAKSNPTGYYEYKYKDKYADKNAGLGAYYDEKTTTPKTTTLSGYKLGTYTKTSDLSKVWYSYKKSKKVGDTQYYYWYKHELELEDKHWVMNGYSMVHAQTLIGINAAGALEYNVPFSIEFPTIKEIHVKKTVEDEPNNTDKFNFSVYVKADRVVNVVNGNEITISAYLDKEPVVINGTNYVLLNELSVIANQTETVELPPVYTTRVPENKRITADDILVLEVDGNGKTYTEWNHNGESDIWTKYTPENDGVAQITYRAEDDSEKLLAEYEEGNKPVEVHSHIYLEKTSKVIPTTDIEGLKNIANNVYFKIIVDDVEYLLCLTLTEEEKEGNVALFDGEKVYLDNYYKSGKNENGEYYVEFVSMPFAWKAKDTAPSYTIIETDQNYDPYFENHKDDPTSLWYLYEKAPELENVTGKMDKICTVDSEHHLEDLIKLDDESLTKCVSKAEIKNYPKTAIPFKLQLKKTNPEQDNNDEVTFTRDLVQMDIKDGNLLENAKTFGNRTINVVTNGEVVTDSDIIYNYGENTAYFLTIVEDQESVEPGYLWVDIQAGDNVNENAEPYVYAAGDDKSIYQRAFENKDGWAYEVAYTANNEMYLTKAVKYITKENASSVKDFYLTVGNGPVDSDYTKLRIAKTIKDFDKNKTYRDEFYFKVFYKSNDGTDADIELSDAEYLQMFDISGLGKIEDNVNPFVVVVTDNDHDGIYNSESKVVNYTEWEEKKNIKVVEVDQFGVKVDDTTNRKEESLWNEYTPTQSEKLATLEQFSSEKQAQIYGHYADVEFENTLSTPEDLVITFTKSIKDKNGNPLPLEKGDVFYFNVDYYNGDEKIIEELSEKKYPIKAYTGEYAENCKQADFNDNGIVDVLDMSLLLRFISEDRTLPEDVVTRIIKAGDINEDNFIRLSDEEILSLYMNTEIYSRKFTYEEVKQYGLDENAKVVVTEVDSEGRTYEAWTKAIKQDPSLESDVWDEYKPSNEKGEYSQDIVISNQDNTYILKPTNIKEDDKQLKVSLTKAIIGKEDGKQLYMRKGDVFNFDIEYFKKDGTRIDDISLVGGNYSFNNYDGTTTTYYNAGFALGLKNVDDADLDELLTYDVNMDGVIDDTDRALIVKYIARLIPDEEITTEYYNFSQIDIGCVVRLNKILSGGAEATSEDFEKLDVDGDGQLTTEDRDLAKRFLAEEIFNFNGVEDVRDAVKVAVYADGISYNRTFNKNEIEIYGLEDGAYVRFTERDENGKSYEEWTKNPDKNSMWAKGYTPANNGIIELPITEAGQVHATAINMKPDIIPENYSITINKKIENITAKEFEELDQDFYFKIKQDGEDVTKTLFGSEYFTLNPKTNNATITIDNLEGEHTFEVVEYDSNKEDAMTYAEYLGKSNQELEDYTGIWGRDYINPITGAETITVSKEDDKKNYTLTEANYKLKDLKLTKQLKEGIELSEEDKNKQFTIYVKIIPNEGQTVWLRDNVNNRLNEYKNKKEKVFTASKTIKLKVGETKYIKGIAWDGTEEPKIEVTEKTEDGWRTAKIVRNGDLLEFIVENEKPTEASIRLSKALVDYNGNPTSIDKDFDYANFNVYLKSDTLGDMLQQDDTGSYLTYTLKNAGLEEKSEPQKAYLQDTNNTISKVQAISDKLKGYDYYVNVPVIVYANETTGYVDLEGIAIGKDQTLDYIAVEVCDDGYDYADSVKSHACDTLWKYSKPKDTSKDQDADFNNQGVASGKLTYSDKFIASDSKTLYDVIRNIDVNFYKEVYEEKTVVDEKTGEEKTQRILIEGNPNVDDDGKRIPVYVDEDGYVTTADKGTEVDDTKVHGLAIGEHFYFDIEYTGTERDEELNTSIIIGLDQDKNNQLEYNQEIQLLPLDADVKIKITERDEQGKTHQEWVNDGQPKSEVWTKFTPIDDGNDGIIEDALKEGMIEHIGKNLELNESPDGPLNLVKTIEGLSNQEVLAKYQAYFEKYKVDEKITFTAHVVIKERENTTNLGYKAKDGSIGKLPKDGYYIKMNLDKDGNCKSETIPVIVWNGDAPEAIVTEVTSEMPEGFELISVSPEKVIINEEETINVQITNKFIPDTDTKINLIKNLVDLDGNETTLSTKDFVTHYEVYLKSSKENINYPETLTYQLFDSKGNVLKLSDGTVSIGTDTDTYTADLKPVPDNLDNNKLKDIIASQYDYYFTVPVVVAKNSTFGKVQIQTLSLANDETIDYAAVEIDPAGEMYNTTSDFWKSTKPMDVVIDGETKIITKSWDLNLTFEDLKAAVLGDETNILRALGIFKGKLQSKENKNVANISAFDAIRNVKVVFEKLVYDEKGVKQELQKGEKFYFDIDYNEKYDKYDKHNFVLGKYSDKEIADAKEKGITLPKLPTKYTKTIEFVKFDDVITLTVTEKDEDGKTFATWDALTDEDAKAESEIWTKFKPVNNNNGEFTLQIDSLTDTAEPLDSSIELKGENLSNGKPSYIEVIKTVENHVIEESDHFYFKVYEGTKQSDGTYKYNNDVTTKLFASKYIENGYIVIDKAHKDVAGVKSNKPLYASHHYKVVEYAKEEKDGNTEYVSYNDFIKKKKSSEFWKLQYGINPDEESKGIAYIVVDKDVSKTYKGEVKNIKLTSLKIVKELKDENDTTSDTFDAKVTIAPKAGTERIVVFKDDGSVEYDSKTNTNKSYETTLEDIKVGEERFINRIYFEGTEYPTWEVEEIDNNVNWKLVGYRVNDGALQEAKKVKTDMTMKLDWNEIVIINEKVIPEDGTLTVTKKFTDLSGKKDIKLTQKSLSPKFDIYVKGNNYEDIKEQLKVDDVLVTDVVLKDNFTDVDEARIGNDEDYTFKFTVAFNEIKETTTAKVTGFIVSEKVSVTAKIFETDGKYTYKEWQDAGKPTTDLWTVSKPSNDGEFERTISVNTKDAKDANVEASNAVRNIKIDFHKEVYEKEEDGTEKLIEGNPSKAEVYVDANKVVTDKEHGSKAKDEDIHGIAIVEDKDGNPVSEHFYFDVEITDEEKEEVVIGLDEGNRLEYVKELELVDIEKDIKVKITEKDDQGLTYDDWKDNNKPESEVWGDDKFTPNEEADDETPANDGIIVRTVKAEEQGNIPLVGKNIKPEISEIPIVIVKNLVKDNDNTHVESKSDFKATFQVYVKGYIEGTQCLVDGNPVSYTYKGSEAGEAYNYWEDYTAATTVDIIVPAGAKADSIKKKLTFKVQTGNTLSYKVVEVDPEGNSYNDRGESEYWKKTKPTNLKNGDSAWDYKVKATSNTSSEPSVENKTKVVINDRIRPLDVTFVKHVITTGVDGTETISDEPSKGEKFYFNIKYDGIKGHDEEKYIIGKLTDKEVEEGKEELPLKYESGEILVDLDADVKVTITEVDGKGISYTEWNGTDVSDVWSKFEPSDLKGVWVGEPKSNTDTTISLDGYNQEVETKLKGSLGIRKKLLDANSNPITEDSDLFKEKENIKFYFKVLKEDEDKTFKDAVVDLFGETPYADKIVYLDGSENVSREPIENAIIALEITPGDGQVVSKEITWIKHKVEYDIKEKKLIVTNGTSPVFKVEEVDKYGKTYDNYWDNSSETERPTDSIWVDYIPNFTNEASETKGVQIFTLTGVEMDEETTPQDATTPFNGTNIYTQPYSITLTKKVNGNSIVSGENFYFKVAEVQTVKTEEGEDAETENAEETKAEKVRELNKEELKVLFGIDDSEADNKIANVGIKGADGKFTNKGYAIHFYATDDYKYDTEVAENVSSRLTYRITEVDQFGNTITEYNALDAKDAKEIYKGSVWENYSVENDGTWIATRTQPIINANNKLDAVKVTITKELEPGQKLNVNKDYYFMLTYKDDNGEHNEPEDKVKLEVSVEGNSIVSSDPVEYKVDPRTKTFGLKVEEFADEECTQKIESVRIFVNGEEVPDGNWITVPDVSKKQSIEIKAVNNVEHEAKLTIKKTVDFPENLKHLEKIYKNKAYNFKYEMIKTRIIDGKVLEKVTGDVTGVTIKKSQDSKIIKWQDGEQVSYRVWEVDKNGKIVRPVKVNNTETDKNDQNTWIASGILKEDKTITAEFQPENPEIINDVAIVNGDQSKSMVVKASKTFVSSEKGYGEEIQTLLDEVIKAFGENYTLTFNLNVTAKGNGFIVEKGDDSEYFKAGETLALTREVTLREIYNDYVKRGIINAVINEYPVEFGYKLVENEDKTKSRVFDNTELKITYLDEVDKPEIEITESQNINFWGVKEKDLSSEDVYEVHFTNYYNALRIKLTTNLEGDIWYDEIPNGDKGDNPTEIITKAKDGIKQDGETPVNDAKVVVKRVILDKDGNVVVSLENRQSYSISINGGPEYQIDGQDFLYDAPEDNTNSVKSYENGHWTSYDLTVPAFTSQEQEIGLNSKNGYTVKYDVEFYYDGLLYEPTKSLVTSDKVIKTNTEAEGKTKADIYKDALTENTLKIDDNTIEEMKNNSIAIDDFEYKDKQLKDYTTVSGSEVPEVLSSDTASTYITKGKIGDATIIYSGELNGDQLVSKVKEIKDYPKYSGKATTGAADIRYFFTDDLYLGTARKYLEDGIVKEGKVYKVINEEYYYNVGDYAQHVNLGLVEKSQLDLEVEKDTVAATVLINGNSHIYELDNLIGWKLVENQDIVYNMDYSSPAGKKDIKTFDVYASDYYYRTSVYKGKDVYDAYNKFYKALFEYNPTSDTIKVKDDVATLIKTNELQVYFTYRIRISNNSQKYYVQVNSFDDYSGSMLEYVDVSKGYKAMTEEDKVISEEDYYYNDETKAGLWANINNHDELTNIFADYKDTFIDRASYKKISKPLSENNGLVKTRFELKTDNNATMIPPKFDNQVYGLEYYTTYRVRDYAKSDQEGLVIGDKYNIAEVQSYTGYEVKGSTNRDSVTTYNNVDLVYAHVIDIDSAPGNFNPTTKDIKEDDTSEAVLKFGKAYDISSRTIEGNAWLDINKDGKYNANDDAKVGDITTKLVEVIDIPELNEDGTVNKDGKYKEYEYYWNDQKANPLGNTCGYKFDYMEVSNHFLSNGGIAPGNYVVRFFYGDSKNAFIKDHQASAELPRINGVDYKTTTYGFGKSSEFIDNEWMEIDSISGNTNYARDNEARRLKIISDTQVLDNEKTKTFEVANYQNVDKYVEDKAGRYDIDYSKLSTIKNNTPDYGSDYTKYMKALYKEELEYKNGATAYNGIINSNGYTMFADTAKIKFPIENVKSTGDSTELDILSNEEKEAFLAQGHKVINVKNVDLGLQLRPKTKVYLDKQIESISLVKNGISMVSVDFNIAYFNSEEVRNINDRFDTTELTQQQLGQKILNYMSTDLDNTKVVQIDGENDLYVIATKVGDGEFDTETTTDNKRDNIYVAVWPKDAALNENVNSIQALNNRLDNNGKIEIGFRYINADMEKVNGAQLNIKYRITALDMSEEDYYGTGLANIMNEENEETFATAIEKLSSPLYKLVETKDAEGKVKESLVRRDGNTKTYGEYLGHYYYEGDKGEGDEPVKNNILKVVDYVDRDTKILTDTSTAGQDNNSTWYTGIKNDQKEDVLSSLIDSNVFVQLKNSRDVRQIVDNAEIAYPDGNIVISREDSAIANDLVKGTKADDIKSIYITTATQYSATEDGDTGIDNMAEILVMKNTVGRRDQRIVLGDYNPLAGPEYATKPDETATERVTLTPPTGNQENDKERNFAIAFLAGIVLISGGATAVVLKKKNKKNDNA